MRKQNPKSYDYITSLLPLESENMRLSRQAAEQLKLGGISLSGVEGQMLHFFIRSIGAKKVVEIGTLTGLSAQYILNALPQDGYLWTLEKSQQHADLAASSLDVAIKNNRCEIIVGDALINLPKIERHSPFDAVFIDGNKAAYLDYYKWAVACVRPGGVIIVDNTFLSGAVWGEATEQKFGEKQISAVKEMNALAFQNETLHSAMIPTTEGLLITFKK